MRETKLSIANALMRQKQFDKALESYEKLIKELPEQSSQIEFNIDLIRKQLSKNTKYKEKLKKNNYTAYKNDGEGHVIFTIVARNYFSYAKVLMKSLNTYHPEVKKYIVISDEYSGEFDEDIDRGYDVLSFKELAIPFVADMLIRYDVMEFSTAIKPFLFQYFLKNKECKYATYLDPDIKLYSPMKEVVSALQQEWDAVVTPHITEPYNDKLDPSDHAIIKSGVYNCGFISFRKSKETVVFLKWWSEKLKTKALSDIKNNLFTDQRWVDLITSFIGKTKIVRNYGYNVAYWNLHERKILNRNNVYFSNSEELSFFHFSGIDPKNPSRISKHSNRYSIDDIGDASLLIAEYLSELVAEGYYDYIRIPYAYQKTEGFGVLHPIVRMFYRDFFENTQSFDLNIISEILIEAANSRAIFKTKNNGEMWLTALMLYVYKARLDLQMAFKLNSDNDINEYIKWFNDAGKRDYNLPDIVTSKAFDRGVDKVDYCTVVTQHGCMKYPKHLLELIYNSRSDISETIGPLNDIGYERLASWAVNSIYDQYGYLADEHLSGRRSNVVKEFGSVNIIGYMQGEFGLGEVARGTYRAFESCGIKCKVTNFDFGLTVRQNAKFEISNQICGKSGQSLVNIFHVNADQLLHAYSRLGVKLFKGSYNIGYLHWELDRVPKSWRYALSLLDEIWAPSEFVADAFRSLTGKPIVVVGQCVDLEADTPIDSSEFDWGNDITFLFAFDMGSFISRKNPFGLIDAFQLAFPQGNLGVKLIIKITNHNANGSAWARLIQLANSDTRIILICETYDKHKYLSLIKSVDCYISLHRSEGFGRGPAEAMLFEKPVILTGYGGVKYYANNRNACLVDYDEIDLDPLDYPFGEGCKWADPDISCAADFMVKLAADENYRRLLGVQGRRSIEYDLSPKKIGTGYTERLSSLGLL